VAYHRPGGQTCSGGGDLLIGDAEEDDAGPARRGAASQGAVHDVPGCSQRGRQRSAETARADDRYFAIGGCLRMIPFQFPHGDTGRLGAGKQLHRSVVHPTKGDGHRKEWYPSAARNNMGLL
jgi:hypothetical protein